MWLYGASEQNVDWVMGDTPETVMTTRAPAVLKINSQNAGMQGNDKINSHILGIRGYHFQKSNGWERELEWRLVVNLKRSWQVFSAQALFKH